VALVHEVVVSIKIYYERCFFFIVSFGILGRGGEGGRGRGEGG
jgi:hypothetical protein